MNTVRLKPRLAAAAGFARPGKRFADIGTDHAYLPVFLCRSGIAPGGIASDVRPGPLERAEAHISEAGLSDRIAVRLADGLQGAEAFAPEDIFILGMGGELIASILAAAPWVKRPGIRLILQPMTHPQDLRAFLLSGGFRLEDEILSEEDGRIYQILCAEYDGTVRHWTAEELAVGRRVIARRDPLLPEYARRLCAVWSKAAEGTEKAGKDASELRGLIKKMSVFAQKSD